MAGKSYKPKLVVTTYNTGAKVEDAAGMHRSRSCRSYSYADRRPSRRSSSRRSSAGYKHGKNRTVKQDKLTQSFFLSGTAVPRRPKEHRSKATSPRPHSARLCRSWSARVVKSASVLRLELMHNNFKRMIEGLGTLVSHCREKRAITQASAKRIGKIKEEAALLITTFVAETMSTEREAAEVAQALSKAELLLAGMKLMVAQAKKETPDVPVFNEIEGAVDDAVSVVTAASRASSVASPVEDEIEDGE